MGINKLLKWADTNIKIKKKEVEKKKNEIKKIQKAHRKFEYNIINIIKKILMQTSWILDPKTHKQVWTQF